LNPHQYLIDDIRLLGRMLGDVIREQEGEASFELVEKIRTLSVAFRRDADQRADRALKQLLKGLPARETLRVIRAFTYFSHLVNLAEDRHLIRRRTAAERSGQPLEGSLSLALARLREAGVGPARVTEALARSYLSPVLTAHPTEGQRKSILDAERGVAQLLAARDDIRERERLHAGRKDVLTPRELADNAARIRVRVMQLWQTRLVRLAKLQVEDEIENALSYYEATFLREIPHVYADLERDLGRHDVAPFLRMGHWIGGDRDGNPNVTAKTLSYALRRQCETALRHYLEEVHLLGGELSQSAALVSVTAPMQALTDASGDHGEHRGLGLAIATHGPRDELVELVAAAPRSGHREADPSHGPSGMRNSSTSAVTTGAVQVRSSWNCTDSPSTLSSTHASAPSGHTHGAPPQ
jgi:phosphoenolpyruvate carboxylase